MRLLPYLVLAILGHIRLVLALSLDTYGVTSSPANISDQTFDYIVVGGGTAGLTVAARLSEDPGVSVLVIEAGPDNRTDSLVTNITAFPAAVGTALDWAYVTDLNKTTSGGKTLGGSSSINGGSWTRGMAAQYDAFTTLLEPSEAGAGWNWNGLFPYMRKAEGYTPPNAHQRSVGADSVDAYHGFVGPVQAAFPSLMFAGPEQPYFAQTVQNLTGIRLLPDLNGGDTNCVAFIPVSLNTHEADVRSSSATAYLSPVESTRTNWVTLVNHQVTKILFADASAPPLTAASVQFAATPPGVNWTAYTTYFAASARREIILAAGSLATPALLQLSGVGAPEHLTSLGITPVINLTTVGRNLQDQSNTPFAATGNGFDKDGAGPNDVLAFPSLQELFGDDADAKAAEIVAGLDDWAESQKEHALSAEALRTIYDAQTDFIINGGSPVVELWYDTGPSPYDLAIAMWDLLPFSRGNVSIVSTDPFVRPQIIVNWFSVPFDMTVHIAGARLARAIFANPPTSTLSLGEAVPGFEVLPANATDDAYAAYLIGAFGSNSHPIGTAAMMRRSLGGVVDATLKVYDTTNLRVVDASILPLQISAHLSSTVYGVAEKAADIIKAANA